MTGTGRTATTQRDPFEPFAIDSNCCGRGHLAQALKSMTSEYTFEVVRELTEEEVSSLAKDRYPSLLAISSRYLPEIDLKTGFPCKPEFLDALRTSWLLDKSKDRPPHVTVIRALGPALGLILHASLGMTWCLIKDTFGESVSMVGSDHDGGRISVPPFSYVEKREHVQNAEVFIDLISLLSSRLAPQAA